MEGDTVLSLSAKVHMEVEGKPIEVEAAVSDRLPVGVLLGMDVSQLPDLLTQQNSEVGEPEKAMVIMTRAAEEEKCGVTLSPLMNEEQKTEAKGNDCDKEEEDKSEHKEEDE